MSRLCPRIGLALAVVATLLTNIGSPQLWSQETVDATSKFEVKLDGKAISPRIDLVSGTGAGASYERREIHWSALRLHESHFNSLMNN